MEAVSYFLVYGSWIDESKIFPCSWLSTLHERNEVNLSFLVRQNSLKVPNIMKVVSMKLKTFLAQISSSSFLPFPPSLLIFCELVLRWLSRLSLRVAFHIFVDAFVGLFWLLWCENVVNDWRMILAIVNSSWSKVRSLLEPRSIEGFVVLFDRENAISKQFKALKYYCASLWWIWRLLVYGTDLKVRRWPRAVHSYFPWNFDVYWLTWSEIKSAIAVSFKSSTLSFFMTMQIFTCVLHAIGVS